MSGNLTDAQAESTAAMCSRAGAVCGNELLAALREARRERDELRAENAEILSRQPFRVAEALRIERDELAGQLGACVCNTGPTTDGPEEDCPRHGRPYAYWVSALEHVMRREEAIVAERDEAKRELQSRELHHFEVERENAELTAKLDAVRERINNHDGGLGSLIGHIRDLIDDIPVILTGPEILHLIEGEA